MISEILFYYESRQNPNGDPGFENQPRLMPDDTIIVTDVRIKRTMRDYARDVHGETLFVDYDKKGNPVMADTRAKDIVGDENSDGDLIKGLLSKTFDVPLFGALVPLRKKNADKGGSEKLTGPLQFGIAKSVNKVQIINPAIAGRFIGKEKKGEQQFSTFGKFYSVEYALIRVHGAVNSRNLNKYENDETILKKFHEKFSMIYDCMWNGTNQLITRSKFPQRSIFYIDIDYKKKIYNDLPFLIGENEQLKGMAKSLGTSPFNFTNLINTMSKRKSEINSIRICGAEDIADDVEKLAAELRANGLDVKILSP